MVPIKQQIHKFRVRFFKPPSGINWIFEKGWSEFNGLTEMTKSISLDLVNKLILITFDETELGKTISSLNELISYKKFEMSIIGLKQDDSISFETMLEKCKITEHKLYHTYAQEDDIEHSLSITYNDIKYIKQIS